MMSTVLVSAFFCSLGAAGFVLSVYLLRLRNVPAVAGCTVILGTALYLLAVNTLGYVVPIQTAFRMGHAVLLLITGLTLLVAWSRSSLRIARKDFVLPPRSYALALLLIIMIAGFAFARDRGSDEWTWFHFALPASIMEGNFPVMDMGNPWDAISYHYGSALFIAALSSLTGITLATAHAFIPVLSVAGIILFAAALAWELTHSWRNATLCAVLALGASGFFWLRGDMLIRDLLDAYVLHRPIVPAHETPLRGVTHMIRDLYSGSLAMLLGHRTIAPGAAFFWALLFGFHQALEKTSWRRAAWCALCVLLGTQLALTNETTLVITFAAALATAAFLGADAVLHRKRRAVFWTFGIVTVFVFAACFLIALPAGGTLTNSRDSVGVAAFVWNFTGRLIIGNTAGNIVTVAPWEWAFFRDFAPPLVSLIVAGAYVWRRRRASPFWVFLWIIAAAHLLPTWVLTYLPFPANLFRLAFIANSVIGFLFAAACYDWIFSQPKGRARVWKILAGVWIAALLLSSVLHVFTRLFFPNLRMELSPLFPAMPQVTTEEADFHRWVREKTEHGDWFYMYEEEKGIPLAVQQQMRRDRMLFSMYTGRFAVGDGGLVSPAPEKSMLLVSLRDRCDAKAFDELGIRYLVLTHAAQEDWFLRRCRGREWMNMYPEQQDGRSLPRVYSRGK